MLPYKRISKGALGLLVAGAISIGGAGIGYANLASAQSTTQGSSQTEMRSRRPLMGGPTIMGTVSAVNGNTLTVTSTKPKSTINTTYTVDVSGATIHKSVAGAMPTVVTVGSIAVGDSVSVHGTISGTSVKATEVMDGLMTPRGGPGMIGKQGKGVMGTVSAVNGNTVTITNPDGTTYTVDATNAKISKISTISVSGITVGDKIGVQGSLNGTSVTALNIMDGVK